MSNDIVPHCIEIQRHGATVHENVAEFADDTIQDFDMAVQVLESMLDRPDQEYAWNEDEPEFYETFLITDLDAFKVQLRQFKAEID